MVQLVATGVLLVLALETPASARKCAPPTYFGEVLLLSQRTPPTLADGTIVEAEVERWKAEGELAEHFGSPHELDLLADDAIIELDVR
jgi:hypothetical protein